MRCVASRTRRLTLIGYVGPIAGERIA